MQSQLLFKNMQCDGRMGVVCRAGCACNVTIPRGRLGGVVTMVISVVTRARTGIVRLSRRGAPLPRGKNTRLPIAIGPDKDSRKTQPGC
jgi:hypothetical protein